MSIRRVLLPEAAEELLGAAEWYEARRPGLGVEFVGAIEVAMTAVESSPSAGPPGPQALDTDVGRWTGSRSFLSTRSARKRSSSSRSRTEVECPATGSRESDPGRRRTRRPARDRLVAPRRLGRGIDPRLRRPRLADLRRSRGSTNRVLRRAALDVPAVGTHRSGDRSNRCPRDHRAAVSSRVSRSRRHGRGRHRVSRGSVASSAAGARARCGVSAVSTAPGSAGTGVSSPGCVVRSEPRGSARGM